MSRPPATLLVTLTGRDRPGVTSRLFTGLSAHELTVLDVEQVVIRGYLVLGVLLACPRSPDLTGIHRQISSLSDDLGMNAEITLGSGDESGRRGRLLHHDAGRRGRGRLLDRCRIARSPFLDGYVRERRARPLPQHPRHYLLLRMSSIPTRRIVSW